MSGEGRPEKKGLSVLLVDDEPAIRMDIAYALGDAGYQVTEASDGAEASALIAERAFDIAVFDVLLPKMSGLALFRMMREQSPGTAVILMTARATVLDAVAAVKDGAFDYVTKPFDSEDFVVRIIGRAAERCLLRKELDWSRSQQAGPGQQQPLIGRSPAILRLVQQIDTIAASDAAVLITGESGTGKELVARMLHDRSPRKKGPFVAVNCAALPETLLEAELFGHERGAFTGADKKREGRFKTADGGTLLLDEVSEIPLLAQAKLLRVLQEGTVEPLGSSISTSVDVRIISATNRSLKELVAAHRFREDLFYRLNVLDLSIPPLRERRGDLPLLLDHFLRRFVPPGEHAPAISPRAWAAISEYAFPGNVREFQHTVERAVVLARGKEIDLEHLPPDGAGKSAPQGELPAPGVSGGIRPLAVAIREFEHEYLSLALAKSAGKRAEAAKLLGISRKNLWQKLRQHGIAGPEKDPELGAEE